VLSYGDDEINGAKHMNILMMTKRGLVKKTSFDKYSNIRSNGLVAIKLMQNDQLHTATITDGKKNTMIISKGGKAILFKESEVRETGRSSQGVKAISLGASDEVVAADVFGDEELKKTIVVIGSKGIGKQVKLSNFNGQHRGGKGVKIAPNGDKMGIIAFAQITDPDAQTVIITSKHGQVVKTPINKIPKYSRTAKGVILMRFSKKEDCVVTATFI